MDRARESLLTVHHDPRKAATYAALRPFVYDEQLRCWCVFDKEMVAAIFQSDRFHVSAYADSFREIARRTSIDFDAIVDTLDAIPLANEGADHKRLREAFAAVMGRDGRGLFKAMEAHVTSLAREAFVAGNEVDLTAFVGDIYNRLFAHWLGTDQSDIVRPGDFSQIFDRTRSLNRRKRMNASLAALIAAFGEQSDRLAASPQMAVAMNVVGRDAFVGSLVLSLWEMLARHPGARLCEIAFPESLPATGVPYVERVAVEDGAVGGMSVRKGERVRLVLDATAMHVSGEEANLLFGKGRHLCLGKPVSLVVWRALAAVSGTIQARFTPGDFRIRAGDYVFSYPEHALVRFHD